MEVDDGVLIELDGPPGIDAISTGRRVSPVRRLAPIFPTVVFCIGVNYRLHATEFQSNIPDYPIVFMKSPWAVQDPDAPVYIPRFLSSEEVDYEGELAVVIGKTCRNVTRETALDYVMGYTCANDITARDWQKKKGGGQWCRGKTFDTFAPLGPCLVTPDEIPNPNVLSIKTSLNGQVVQDSTTANMIFDVQTLIAFLSGSTTLPVGTVIMTGTPEGVGMARNPPLWLRPGDELQVSIEGIGTLRNNVEIEPPN